MRAAHTIPSTTPADMLKTWQCTKRFFSAPADLPVSFVLDGKPIRGIREEWRPTAKRRRIDANISETVFEGTDPDTGLRLRVECQKYHDYPVVEWTAWLSNEGAQPTPVIRDILALDAVFAGAAPVVQHGNGDFCSADGYTCSETALREGDELAFAPTGGRPCDGAFPYYRVGFEDGGMALAIGWPGQWRIRFEARADGTHIEAGQEITNLRLMPGERIRTPRVTILLWSGDDLRAVNLWRRWYLAHVLPRPDGRPLRPLLACAGTDEGVEFTGATEENQIRYIDKFHNHGIEPDVWWIDAGWYPCRDEKGERRWQITGTWRPDPERFPNGLKPVADHASRAGADLLLWFEPERVRSGTWLDTERPEWLLRIEGNENRMLNLGNPECLRWLTDHVCNLIRDNGIRIYRQDFNFAPLEYWRANEPEDRQGMNENLYVQGYLQYWDDLLERNPGLWIDSCASGGRRNDLETLRRSVPLHYTDYGYGDHPVKLAFHHTMYEWIPYFKEFTRSWDLGNTKGYQWDDRVDRFSFHCGMAPMLWTSLDIRRDDYDYALACEMVGVWRKAAGLLLHGDYYPLTPPDGEADGWVLWQFDLPEEGRGLVQGIRLPDAPREAVTVRLENQCPDTTYLLENPETGETREARGADLTGDGLSFELEPRSGVIWFYRRKGGLTTALQASR